jgi:hypothetical protein
MNCPSHKIVPPARYKENVGELEQTSHCGAIMSVSAVSTAPELTSSPLCESLPPPQMDAEDASSLADPLQAQHSLKHPSHSIQNSLSLDSVIVLSPTTSDGAPDTVPQSKKPKNVLTSGNREDALTSIIDIDNIDDPQDEWLNKSDATADLKYFFTVVPRVAGQAKVGMKCNLCT